MEPVICDLVALVTLGLSGLGLVTKRGLWWCSGDGSFAGHCSVASSGPSWWHLVKSETVKAKSDIYCDAASPFTVRMFRFVLTACWCKLASGLLNPRVFLKSAQADGLEHLGTTCVWATVTSWTIFSASCKYPPFLSSSVRECDLKCLIILRTGLHQPGVCVVICLPRKTEYVLCV